MKKIILTTEQLSKIAQHVSKESDSEVINETISNSGDYEMECDVDLDYYGLKYKGEDIEYVDVLGPLKIKFNIELESRSWGIKSVYVSVVGGPESLPLSLKYYPEDSDDYQEVELELPINWDSVNEEGEETLGYIGIGQSVDIKLANNDQGDIYIDGITVITTSI